LGIADWDISAVARPGPTHPCETPTRSGDEALGADQVSEVQEPASKPAAARWPPSRYRPTVGVVAIVLVVAWLLPFAKLEATPLADSGHFDKQIWPWDLAAHTLPLLLVPAALGFSWYLTRERAASIGAVVIVFFATVAGNTYLASGLADRDRHDVPLPALIVPEHPTIRCDSETTPPSAGREFVPTYSCAFGLAKPVNELEARLDPSNVGLPGFDVGVGPRLFVLLTGLLAIWSAWILLRYRLSLVLSAVLLAAAIAALGVVSLLDWVSHW
jgi:hypothetical protein